MKRITVTETSTFDLYVPEDIDPDTYDAFIAVREVSDEMNFELVTRDWGEAL